MDRLDQESGSALRRDGQNSGEVLGGNRRGRSLLVAGLTIVLLAWLAYRSYLALRPPEALPQVGPGSPKTKASSATPALMALAQGKEEEPPKAKTEPPMEFPAELPASTEALLREADEAIGRVARRYANDADAYEMKARLHLYRGETAEAVKSWQRCLELNLEYAHAYEGLGSVAARQGQYQEAVSHYRRAVRLMPTSGQTQMELARSLIELGELDEAITLLQRSIPIPLPDAERLVLLGTAYTQKQDHAKAKQSYEAAVARNPRHVNAHWGLGNACTRLGLQDEARQHLEEFQKLKAGERDLRQLQRNQYDDLQAMSEDIAAIYTNSARIYLTHGDGNDAEQLWKRAARLHPGDTNCRQALAWFYLQQQRLQNTISMLEELDRLEPKNYSYKLEISRLYADMNRIDVAEKTLQELRVAWPNEPLVYSALAELYLRSNEKPKEMLEVSRRLAELDPTAANFVNLAAAFERNNDVPNALVTMNTAMEKEPGNAQYRQMYESLKRKTEGQRAP